MKTVIRIYTPAKTDYETISFQKDLGYTVSLLFFLALNLCLGFYSDPIVQIVEKGLTIFD